MIVKGVPFVKTYLPKIQKSSVRKSVRKINKKFAKFSLNYKTGEKERGYLKKITIFGNFFLKSLS